MPELFTGDTVTAAMHTASAAPPAAASPASEPTATGAEVSSAVDPAAIPQSVEAGATVTTDSDPATAKDPTTTGVPPEERWPTILANARTKAADEIKAQYAWAERIPAPHRATVSEFYQTLDTEPVQAIEALIATAAEDPIHAPQLRSLLGRLLRGAADKPVTSPAPAATSTLPVPDFQDERGNQFFSADKILELAEAIEARIDAKYAAELDPLKTDFLTRDAKARAAAKHTQATTDAKAWADARYAKVSQWAHFKAYEKDILAALEADPDLDVADVYIDLVVPQLSLQERKKVVTSLQDKAGASSVNPSSPASAVAQPPRTFAEGLRQMGVGG